MEVQILKTRMQCLLFIFCDEQCRDIRVTGSSSKRGKIKAYVIVPTIILKSYPKICQLFHKNDVEVLGNQAFPALCLALKNDKVEMLELIIAKGKLVEPLQICVEVTNVEIVSLILSKNFVVNKMKFDPSPLCSAVDESNTKTVKSPLAVRADIKYGSPSGGTLLHFAVLRNSDILVKALLEHGACVDSQRDDGATPLHLAVQNGSVLFVELLLKNGASVAARKNDGSTCLYLAVAMTQERMFDLLVKNGATLPTDIDEHFKLLNLALQMKCDKIVIKLLLLGCNNTPAVVEESNMNNRLLPLAVEKRLVAVVIQLLAFGLDVNAQGVDGQTVLCLAVAQESPEMVECILKHNPDLSDAKNKIALRESVLQDGETSDKIVKMLLQHGFTVDVKEKNNIKLFHTAVRKNYADVVQQLLQFGADANEKYSNFDNTSYSEEVTVLIVAVRSGHTDMIKMLLDNGAKATVECEWETTAIKAAVEKSDASAVKLLLEHGAVVKYYPDVFITAVRKGSKEIVEALLKHGANPDMWGSSKEEPIPLTVAAEKNDLAFLDLLLKYGANINGADAFGRTALHNACGCAHLSVIEYLIRNNAFLEVEDSKGVTPLSYADEESAVDMLLKSGARFDCKNEEGCSPLSSAALDLKGGIFKAYLNNGFTDEELLSKTGICELFNVAFVARLGYLDAFKQFYLNKKKFKKFAMKLVRHMVKMQAAGVLYDQIHPTPEWYCEEMSKEDFQLKCQAEIARMKTVSVDGTNVTYFDILTSGMHCLTCYARNDNIVKMQEAGDFIKSFPIYASIISCQVRKGIFQRDLLIESAKIFRFVFKELPKLPCCVVEKILCYLRNQEIMVFMSAVTPMAV